MGNRKVTVKPVAAEAIATIAWYIESKGLIATADKFADDIYMIISSQWRITENHILHAGNQAAWLWVINAFPTKRNILLSL